MIHGGLLVILHLISIGWVIDIDCIAIFVKLNNKTYILCYCILNYDDDRTFDLYVSYMSFIIIFITNLESIINYYLFYNCFESVKELHKVPF